MSIEATKPTILIVDDDKANATLLSMLLSDDYDTVVVHDGSQAIHAVNSSRPDLVLLDLVMPGLNGHEVFDEFKAIYPDDPLTVIFLTGTNDKEAEVKALTEGAADFINKPYRAEVVLARVRLQLELQARTKQLKEANEKLEELARIDPLTQVANRRHFDEVAYTEVERAMRGESDLSFIVVDIDNFKSINDNYGHQAGDLVLKEFARAAKAAIRVSDLIARIGGEEFVYLLPNVDKQQAVEAAERFRANVAAMSIDIDEGLVINITVSSGVAQYQPNEPVEDTLERADTAMFLAKRLGKNRVCSEVEHL